jgi:LacI family transcriptional regulator
VAKASGVSVATVDRVLNQRAQVREPTARRVLEAAQSIGFHGAPLIARRLRTHQKTMTFGFVLQRRTDVFYQELSAALHAAVANNEAVVGRVVVEFIDELSPQQIAGALRKVGDQADAIAVVAVDHPHISEAIEHLSVEGIPTFAILTDLTASACAGYIGRDNRKEGRTAAWMIDRTAGAAGGAVGIIIGSHRYLCQETAEISFRSYFREHAPRFQVMEPIVNLEDPRIAFEATGELLAEHPSLAGLYICGGGADGVIQAMREYVPRVRPTIICNELTAATRAGLIDRILTMVISTPVHSLAHRTVAAMVGRVAQPVLERSAHTLVPFDIFVSENV